MKYETAKKKYAPGEGGRFKAIVSELKSKGGVSNPGAVAASIGRNKYGAKKMGKFSAQGRKKD